MVFATCLGAIGTASSALLGLRNARAQKLTAEENKKKILLDQLNFKRTTYAQSYAPGFYALSRTMEAFEIQFQRLKDFQETGVFNPKVNELDEIKDDQRAVQRFRAEIELFENLTLLKLLDEFLNQMMELIKSFEKIYRQDPRTGAFRVDSELVNSTITSVETEIFGLRANYSSLKVAIKNFLTDESLP